MEGGGVRTTDLNMTAVDRIWHIYDSPGLGFLVKVIKNLLRGSLFARKKSVECEATLDRSGGMISVGSEGRRGRWGTPTKALHIRIQHREKTGNASQIRQSYTNPSDRRAKAAAAPGGKSRT